MFQFRLAAIMRLREYHEKQRREEVARCLQLLNAALRRENELKEQLSDLEKEIAERQEGTIQIEDVVIRQNYRIYLQKLLDGQSKLVALRQNQLQEAKQKLLEAMKEKKVLQKLQEKKFAEYVYEQEKKEQALQDELAGGRRK
ncbi:MAG: flagellar export protein FliJ [Clostridia bacterium]|jgi:flagellar FliJ protein|nr:flagellar export protein FliJ [Clostridia bacterium]